MSVLNDFHRSDLSPLVDQGRHHGHQFRARGMNSEWSRRENNGKILANGRSSSSSSTSGKIFSKIRISSRMEVGTRYEFSLYVHSLNDFSRVVSLEI